MTIKFDASIEEIKYIRTIADRAFSAGIYSQKESSIHKVMLDVTAVHCNGCRLDLAELARADAINFAHDVAGIRRHLDRETGQLLNQWTPRYLAPTHPPSYACDCRACRSARATPSNPHGFTGREG